MFYKLGAACFLAANFPALIAACQGGAVAPIGFLLLIEAGILAYVADCLHQKRPRAFLVVNLVNLTLNTATIILGHML